MENMKLWDWVVWHQGLKWKTVKNYWGFYAIKKKLLLFLFMYKMYLILAEGYKNAEFDSKIVRKTGELWVSMKDVWGGMGVKNIPDLVLKEITTYLRQKNPRKEQINEYKMIERELYKNFDKLSEEDLNTKNNKTIYVRNDDITTVIKHSRGEKKEAQEQ